MKSAFSCFLLLTVILSLTAVGHADCSSVTLNSFTVSPSVISGDQSQFTVGTVSACLPSGITTLDLFAAPSLFSVTQMFCNGEL